MKYDAVRWVYEGGTMWEWPESVEADTPEEALAQLQEHERGPVVLILLRPHRNRAPWECWARDYSLPVPDRGRLGAFGPLQVDSTAFGFRLRDSSSPIQRALTPQLKKALRPLWGRLRTLEGWK